jgi:hypothetical protein
MELQEGIIIGVTLFLRKTLTALNFKGIFQEFLRREPKRRGFFWNMV